MSILFEKIFLQRQFLLPDIVNLVVSIFIHLQKFESGQILFNSPCGHLLRTCDSSHFDEEKIYSRKIKPWTGSYLAEIRLDFKSDISCYVCDRYWCDTHECETDLRLKIICFCGKIDFTFPCFTCSIKKCAIDDCMQLSGRTTWPILCIEHHQCETCKQPFTYQCTKIYAEDYIECACQKCKKLYGYYDYDVELFQKVCDK